MSTIPPAPPPPPPPRPPPLDLHLPLISPPCYTNSPSFTYSNICEWETEYPQLWEACAKYNICLHETPFKYQYKHIDSILQVGPTCGIVALSMIVNGEVTPEEILNISKMEGYSCNGEMFSCKNMIKLTEKVLSLAEMQVSYSLKVGGLFSHETIEKLLNGALLLVPYDADNNHSPCLKQGHTAHWALVCGVIITDDPGDCYSSEPSNVHVFCRHGKSRYLAAWRLDELDRSNKNLREFSPKRGAEGLMYVLPEGGVGGENGLRDQYLIFEGLN